MGRYKYGLHTKRVYSIPLDSILGKPTDSGGATGYAIWATAYPVAQHSPTHNTCIYIKKICMLEFYLAEHTQALATAVRPLLIVASGVQPRTVTCPVCRLPSQVLTRRRDKALSRYPRFIYAIYFVKYLIIAFSIVPYTCNLLSIIK